MINIGILGFGTVGKGFYDLFQKNQEKLIEKLGQEVRIVKIYDKRQFEGLPMTDDLDILYSENFDIVIEAMGGTTHAYDLVSNFLRKKVHVITSNKDLVAEHGCELIRIAKENGVMLSFEASVGGGIPILKPIRESLTSNAIWEINAILNGTTNYILSKMYDCGMSYETALIEAQSLGYAEANPKSDVEGLDAARKLSILSSMSFEEIIPYKSFKTLGITNIKKMDIEYAKENNFKIKLIAKASKVNDVIYAGVRPTFVRCNSQFGNIDDSFNGIQLKGDAVGELIFIGRGAGSLPTATSIFADMEDILFMNNNKPRYSHFNAPENTTSKQIFLDPENQDWIIVTNSSENPYIRIDNVDELGVIEEMDALFLRGIKSSQYYPVMK